MAEKNTAKKAASPKPEGDKPKRVVLTPAERIAKAQEALEALKQKEATKATKKAGVAKEKLGKLVEKRDKLNAQISELESQVTAGTDESDADSTDS